MPLTLKEIKFIKEICQKYGVVNIGDRAIISADFAISMNQDSHIHIALRNNPGLDTHLQLPMHGNYKVHSKNGHYRDAKKFEERMDYDDFRINTETGVVTLGHKGRKTNNFAQGFKKPDLQQFAEDAAGELQRIAKILAKEKNILKEQDKADKQQAKAVRIQEEKKLEIKENSQSRNKRITQLDEDIEHVKQFHEFMRPAPPVSLQTKYDAAVNAAAAYCNNHDLPKDKKGKNLEVHEAAIFTAVTSVRNYQQAFNEFLQQETRRVEQEKLAQQAPKKETNKFLMRQHNQQENKAKLDALVPQQMQQQCAKSCAEISAQSMNAQQLKTEISNDVHDFQLLLAGLKSEYEKLKRSKTKSAVLRKINELEPGNHKHDIRLEEIASNAKKIVALEKQANELMVKINKNVEQYSRQVKLAEKGKKNHAGNTKSLLLGAEILMVEKHSKVKEIHEAVESETKQSMAALGDLKSKVNSEAKPKPDSGIEKIKEFEKIHARVEQKINDARLETQQAAKLEEKDDDVASVPSTNSSNEPIVKKRQKKKKKKKKKSRK